MQLLAKAGLIEIIPWTSYRERLASEHASASGAGCVNASVVGIEWGIRESDGSAYSQNVVIKKSGSTTTFFSAPPDDAPASIKQRFAELASINPNAAFEALAQAKADAAIYNVKSKTFKRY
jgi:hypothetical protein